MIMRNIIKVLKSEGLNLFYTWQTSSDQSPDLSTLLSHIAVGQLNLTLLLRRKSPTTSEIGRYGRGSWRTCSSMAANDLSRLLDAWCHFSLKIHLGASFVRSSFGTISKNCAMRRLKISNCKTNSQKKSPQKTKRRYHKYSSRRFSQRQRKDINQSLL